MVSLKNFRLVAVLLVLCLVFEMPGQALARSYKGKYTDVSSLFKKPKQSDMWLSAGIMAASCILPAAFSTTGTIKSATASFGMGAFTSGISQSAMNLAANQWGFNADAAQVFGYGVSGVLTGMSTVFNDDTAYLSRKGSIGDNWWNSHPYTRGVIVGAFKGASVGGANLLAYNVLKDTGFYKNDPFFANQVSSLLGSAIGHLGSSHILGDWMHVKTTVDIKLKDKGNNEFEIVDNNGEWKGKSYDDLKANGVIRKYANGESYLRISNSGYEKVFGSSKDSLVSLRLAFFDPSFISSMVSQGVGLGIEYAAHRGALGKDLKQNMYYSRALGSSIGGIAGAGATGGRLWAGLGNGILSGGLSAALNGMGGKYNSATGRNKWGLTTTQMAGVTWAGSYLARGAFTKEGWKNGLVDLAYNHTSFGGTSPFFTAGAGGYTEVKYIENLAQYSGYANFKANTDYLRTLYGKGQGKIAWKDFVKENGLSNVFISPETALTRYVTSTLHYSAVDNFSAAVTGMPGTVASLFKGKEAKAQAKIGKALEGEVVNINFGEQNPKLTPVSSDELANHDFIKENKPKEWKDLLTVFTLGLVTYTEKEELAMQLELGYVPYFGRRWASPGTISGWLYDGQGKREVYMNNQKQKLLAPYISRYSYTPSQSLNPAFDSNNPLSSVAAIIGKEPIQVNPQEESCDDDVCLPDPNPLPEKKAIAKETTTDMKYFASQVNDELKDNRNKRTISGVIQDIARGMDDDIVINDKTIEEGDAYKGVSLWGANGLVSQVKPYLDKEFQKEINKTTRSVGTGKTTPTSGASGVGKQGGEDLNPPPSANEKLTEEQGKMINKLNSMSNANKVMLNRAKKAEEDLSKEIKGLPNTPYKTTQNEKLKEMSQSRINIENRINEINSDINNFKAGKTPSSKTIQYMKKFSSSAAPINPGGSGNAGSEGTRSIKFSSRSDLVGKTLEEIQKDKIGGYTVGNLNNPEVYKVISAPNDLPGVIVLDTSSNGKGFVPIDSKGELRPGVVIEGREITYRELPYGDYCIIDQINSMFKGNKATGKIDFIEKPVYPQVKVVGKNGKTYAYTIQDNIETKNREVAIINKDNTIKEFQPLFNEGATGWVAHNRFGSGVPSPIPNNAAAEILGHNNSNIKQQVMKGELKTSRWYNAYYVESPKGKTQITFDKYQDKKINISNENIIKVVPGCNNK